MFSFYNTGPSTTVGAQVSKPQPVGILDTAELTGNLDSFALATRFINSYIQQDADFPSIDNILPQAQSSQYIVCDESDESTRMLVPYVRQSVLSVPDEVFEQINQATTYNKMGLFAPLEIVWVAVDNRFYFWNYARGNSPDDITYIDQLDQAIVSVHFAKAKPGVFKSTIKYTLVLTTPTEMKIMAISTKNGAIECHDLDLSVNVKGLEVDLVVSSDSGRIFFTGRNDGINVWELDYVEEERWFKSQIVKVCRTRNVMSAALMPLAPIISAPSLLSGYTHPEHIIDVKIDDSRQLLYTLSDKCTIRVYDLKTMHNSITYHKKEMVSHIQMLISRKAEVDIVNIDVIPNYAASKFHLMATTKNGWRLFMRIAGWPPSKMQIVQVRFPPAEQPNPATSSPANPASASEFAKKHIESKALDNTRKGKLLAPYHFAAIESSKESPGDTIFVSALDSGRIIRQNNGLNPQYFENSCFLNVDDGYVLDIYQYNTYTKRARGYANETAVEFDGTPRLLVLTNTALYVFHRQMPYEAFQNYQSDTDVRVFYDLYGRAETCCAALRVAISQSATDLAKEYASQVYIEVGDRATYVQDEAISGYLKSSSTTYSKVKLSGRFDGLATYLARLLFDTWSQNVFSYTLKDDPEKKGDSILAVSLRLNLSLLLTKTERLYELSQYFTEHQAVIEEHLLTTAQHSPHNDVCLQAEHRGFDSLLKLIQNLRQGISFLQLLSRETEKTGMASVFLSMKEDSRKKVLESSFESLFVSTAGVELVRELVTCMVNRSIEEGNPVDEISRTLQDNCESFCSSYDAVLYKAMEYLRKARSFSLGDSNAKRKLLYNALDLLQSTADNISLDLLTDIVDSMISLDFIAGAIKVTLAVAAASDRGNRALGFIHDAKRPEDTRAVDYEKRLKYYQLVFSVLLLLDEKPREAEIAYTTCLESSDEVFHWCFYDWLFATGRQALFMNIDTKYLSEYLRVNAKSDLSVADMLRQYYLKHDDFASAAQLLFNLVVGDFGLDLERRIEFLARAKGYISCIPEGRQTKNIATLRIDIQTYLDIASIQDDLMKTIRDDARFKAPQKEQALEKLNGKIKSISELYNDFADVLDYNEIKLRIFYLSDHRVVEDIAKTWEQLIDSCTTNQIVQQKVTILGRQLEQSDVVFPLEFVAYLLEKYALQTDENGHDNWVVNTLLEAGFKGVAIQATLESIMFLRKPPFDEPAGKARLQRDIDYLRSFAAGEDAGYRGLIASVRV